MTGDASGESLSMILPVHNEAEVIEGFIRTFADELASLTDDYEFVVVEDGSTDGTKAILRDLADELPLVLLMDDDRRGYTNALKRGIEVAGGDYLIFTDSDGQHYPEDVHVLWQHREAAPIVVGGRYGRATGRSGTRSRRGTRYSQASCFDSRTSAI